MADVYMRFTGHTLTVGLAKVKFPTPDKYGRVPQPEMIEFQTPSTNTANIYIGDTNVTADNNNGPWLIPPGSNGFLSVACDELLYAISTAAGQVLLLKYLAEKV